MNLWDRNLSKRFLSSFCYSFVIITGLAFFIDYGLHWKDIHKNNASLIEYYLLKSLPFLLLSLPIITFISIHHCFKKLFLNHEIQLVRIYSLNSYSALRVFIFVFVLISILWTGIRELAWPKAMKQDISWLRNAEQEPFTFVSKKGVIWLQPTQLNYQEFSNGVIILNYDSGITQYNFSSLKWDGEKWLAPRQIEFKSIVQDILLDLPEPIKLLEQQGKLTHTSMVQIWKSGLGEKKKFFYLIQRTGLPLMFLLLCLWTVKRYYRAMLPKAQYAFGSFFALVLFLIMSESLIHS